jgi:toxin-antitoxin system PIN domain toxin
VRLFDVNVVVAAFRADHPDHGTARAYVERCLASGEQVGVPWAVWWSFLRVVTHPRIFDPPAAAADALAFVDAFRQQPEFLESEPGPAHLDSLRAATAAGEATGNLIPDAVLAALASDHGATIVTYDRDFARFPDLSWETPQRA